MNQPKKDFKKQKISHWFVPKITKQLTHNAMSTPYRYLETLKPLNDELFIREANRIVNIALSKESKFQTIIEPPEAHKLAIRVNAYMESEAKKLNEEFEPIDADVILKLFEKLRRIYRNLLLYFRGDERSLFDLNKGLYIHGSTGCGKTLAMEVFKIYTSQVLQINSFRHIPASEILDAVYAKGINALDTYIRTPVTYTPINIYIEDFGAGEKNVKFMGNNIEPMGKLIIDRYRYFKKYGTLTHLCTNIKPGDLADHFGHRVCSRFSQMFNIINFNTFDWRKV